MNFSNKKWFSSRKSKLKHNNNEVIFVFNNFINE